MISPSDQCNLTSNDANPSMQHTGQFNPDGFLPEDFFADMYSYTASSPLPPQLSFDEELEQQPDDEINRQFRKVQAEINAKKKSEAEALGFTSWAEKESHDEEEKRKWLEDFIREHGHPPLPPVLTKEQEAAQKLQIERSLALDRKSKLGPGCNCEAHPVIGFCPQKLISYKSQGDDPAEFHFLHSLRPINLDISINEGDSSNRIPDWWLESFWSIQTQPGILRLPQWAKRDEVVQGMINQDEVAEVIYHGDPNRSKGVSLTPGIFKDKNAEDLEEFKRHNQRNNQSKEKDSAIGLASKQTLPNDKSKANQAHTKTPATQPAGSIADRLENKCHPKFKVKASSQPSKNEPRRVNSPLGLEETKRVLRAQASGIKKLPRAMKGATKPASPSDRRQSRSQGALNFNFALKTPRIVDVASV